METDCRIEKKLNWVKLCMTANNVGPLSVNSAVGSCNNDDDRYNAIRLKSNLRLPKESFEIMSLADAAAFVINYY